MEGSRQQRGVTLPELLVVVTIIGMAVLVAVPTVTETIRATRLRTAARSLEATFRAARIVAVTQRMDMSVEIRTGPAAPTPPGPTENQYSFTDLRGRPRTERMPPGIRIVSSTSPVVFRPNGTLDAEALTVLEVQTRQGLKTWEVRTSRMGVTRVID
jgi:prepilin-type N-terminal cleavage/methylation domain-containing protein